MTDLARNAVRIMRGSYGNKWKGDDDVWVDGLKSFDRTTLAHATNAARQDFKEWPPTLMEFRDYCLRRTKQGQPSGDDDLISKWNKWAEKNGLQGNKPGESAENFRRRLVVEYDMRQRGVYGHEYWEIIEENRQAQKRINWHEACR